MRMTGCQLVESWRSQVKRGRGRGRKTRKECVADDMRKLKLKQEDMRKIVLFGQMAF